MYKFFAVLLYSLIVSLSRSLSVLLLMSILPLIFLLARKFPVKRLIKINIVNAVMILTLALTGGGLLTGIIIAIRVNLIFIVFISLLDVKGVYCALLSMKLPLKLCVLFVLTLRGIEILRERLDTALIAARLRAPEAKTIMRLKIFASVIGTVLLQSVMHSENMTRAVKLRGGFEGFRQC